jgi:hypothetical protein
VRLATGKSLELGGPIIDPVDGRQKTLPIQWYQSWPKVLHSLQSHFNILFHGKKPHVLETNSSK